MEEERTPPESVSDVILVGGGMRIPLLRDRIESIFGSQKIHYVADMSDQVLAYGAAARAAEALGYGWSSIESSNDPLYN